MNAELGRLKAELVSFSHKIAARGWVANHDGNLSQRLADGRYLLSPTAMHKGELTHADLIMVDASGAVIDGTRKPFSEWDLHRAAYDTRPDVMAIVHAHPPTATGFALAGVSVESTAMAEPTVSLGRHIPTVPFYLPKSKGGSAAVGRAAFGADVMLLERHGVLALGPTLETAFLRLELVEHLARIQLAARQVGGFSLLCEAEIATLLQARAAADLQTPGEREEPDLRAVIARVVKEELSRSSVQ